MRVDTIILKLILPVMYDQEKFPQLKDVSREEYSKIVKKDFEGVVAQAVYLFENKLYSPVLPIELRKDLNQVIQMHKNENRHVQISLSLWIGKIQNQIHQIEFVLESFYTSIHRLMKKYLQN